HGGARSFEKLRPEMIHHGTERALLARTRCPCRCMDGALTACRVALARDLSQILQLLETFKLGRVLSKDLDQLLDKISDRHEPARTKIDERAFRSIALSPPPVLSNERERIEAPALVLHPQTNEESQQRLVEGCNRRRVTQPRADVRDPRLKRRKSRRRPHIPPDLRPVLDTAGLDEKINKTPE